MPNWTRSWLIPALCIWALAVIWVSHRLPQQPVVWIGIEVILSAALLVAMAWVEGWRKFLVETAPFLVIYGAIFMVPDRFHPSAFSRICYAVILTALLYLYLKLIGADRTADGAPAPSWAQIRADIRAQRAARPARPSFAERVAARRAQRLVPRIKTACVKAADLAGVVEYESMHLPGIRVEECAADWVTQVSQVKTDDDGRFALPHTSDGSSHWVRVSWPGTETVHLQVELDPDAQPLLVRLKYRKPRAY
ncbi:MAG: hypothetical protein ABSE42_10915 [Bryobacteraceae bacterium]